MNISVRDTLLNLGVPKNLVHIEQFGGNIEDTKTDISAVANAKLSAILNGQTHELTIAAGKTLLQTLKEANLNPPFSCESGVCGTCVAKVTKGKAEMKSCMALEDEDVEKGLVLTCQALPTTKVVKIEF